LGFELAHRSPKCGTALLVYLISETLVIQTEKSKYLCLKNTYFKYVKQKTVTEYFVTQEKPQLRSVFEVAGGFRNHVLPRAPLSSINIRTASESHVLFKLVATSQAKGTASVFKGKISSVSKVPCYVGVKEGNRCYKTDIITRNTRYGKQVM